MRRALQGRTAPARAWRRADRAAGDADLQAQPTVKPYFALHDSF